MELWAYVLVYENHLAERGLSDSHREGVRLRLGRFLDGRERDRIDSVNELDIAAHFRRLENDGLARGTLAGHKSSLRAFWRWCVAEGHVTNDPSLVLRRREFSYSYAPVSHVAADEAAFTAVLLALPQFAAHRGGLARDVRDALAVSLAADSAARRGEIWAIRRREMERSLKRPSVLRGGGNVYHVSSTGKTGQANIRFFDQSAEFARMWLDLLPPSASFVFASTKTWSRLPRDYMNSAFRRVCQFANVETFQWQSVRKRVVTDMIAMTGNVTYGQQMAGHASEKTTLQYYNMVEQASVDAAAGMLRRRGEGANDLAAAFFGQIG